MRTNNSSEHHRFCVLPILRGCDCTFWVVHPFSPPSIMRVRIVHDTGVVLSYLPASMVVYVSKYWKLGGIVSHSRFARIMRG